MESDPCITWYAVVSFLFYGGLSALEGPGLHRFIELCNVKVMLNM
jgi:hypothetical protein